MQKRRLNRHTVADLLEDIFTDPARPRGSVLFGKFWRKCDGPGVTPVHARRSPARRPPSRAFPKVSRTPPPRTFHRAKASPRTHDDDGCHATFAEHRRARPRARDSHFRRTVRHSKKIPGVRTASRRYSPFRIPPKLPSRWIFPAETRLELRSSPCIEARALDLFCPRC